MREYNPNKIKQYARNKIFKIINNSTGDMIIGHTWWNLSRYLSYCKDINESYRYTNHYIAWLKDAEIILLRRMSYSTPMELDNNLNAPN